MDEWQLEYLQEEVEGLAEDVVELDERVDDALYTMKWMCENSLEMCNVMRMLDEKIEKVDDAGMYLFRFLVVWNFVLTGVLCYYVF